jgi:hypothetical protein
MDVQPLGQLADHRLWIGLPGQAHRALAQLIGVLLGRSHDDVLPPFREVKPCLEVSGTGDAQGGTALPCRPREPGAQDYLRRMRCLRTSSLSG